MTPDASTAHSAWAAAVVADATARPGDHSEEHALLVRAAALPAQEQRAFWEDLLQRSLVEVGHTPFDDVGEALDAHARALASLLLGEERAWPHPSPAAGVGDVDAVLEVLALLRSAQWRAFAGDPGAAQELVELAEDVLPPACPVVDAGLVAAAVAEVSAKLAQARGDLPTARQEFARALLATEQPELRLRCEIQVGQLDAEEHPVTAAAAFRRAAHLAKGLGLTEVARVCAFEAGRVTYLVAAGALESSPAEAAEHARLSAEDFREVLELGPDEADERIAQDALGDALVVQGTGLAEGHWQAAQPVFAAAVDAYTAAGREDRAASAHFAWGNAAIRSIDPAVARQHLERARTLASAAGAAELLAAVEHHLRGLDLAERASRSAPPAGAAPQNPLLPPLEAAADVVRALDAGDLDAAQRSVAQLLVEAEKTDDPSRQWAARLLAREVAERRGDREVAEELGEQVALGVERPGPPPVAQSVVGLLKARGQLQDGDLAGGLATLYAAHDQALAVGSPVLAAQIASATAEVLLQAGEARTAALLAVPAALVLDAHRFTLPTSARRLAWSGVVAGALATAYRAAARSDPRSLAGLLELARGSGVPLARPSADPLQELLSATTRQLAEDEDASAAPLTGAGVLDGAWAVAAPEEATLLGVPPVVVMPWGEDACAAALRSTGRYTATAVRAPARAPLVVPVAEGPPL